MQREKFSNRARTFLEAAQSLAIRSGHQRRAGCGCRRGLSKLFDGTFGDSEIVLGVCHTAVDEVECALEPGKFDAL